MKKIILTMALAAGIFVYANAQTCDGATTTTTTETETTTTPADSTSTAN